MRRVLTSPKALPGDGPPPEPAQSRPAEGLLRRWCNRLEHAALPGDFALLANAGLQSGHPWDFVPLAALADSGAVAYYRYLYGLAALSDAEVILEVGTAFGLGSAALLQGAPRARRLISLDLGVFTRQYEIVVASGWQHLGGYRERELLADGRNVDFAREALGRLLQRLGRKVDLHLFQVNTQPAGSDNYDALVRVPRWSEVPEVVREIEREPVDLLFIDGKHTGDGLYQDFRSFFRYVRPGGLIVCDDLHDASYPYEWAGQTVASFDRACREFADEIEEAVVWPFPQLPDTPGQEPVRRPWGMVRKRGGVSEHTGAALEAPESGRSVAAIVDLFTRHPEAFAYLSSRPAFLEDLDRFAGQAIAKDLPNIRVAVRLALKSLAGTYRATRQPLPELAARKMPAAPPLGPPPLLEPPPPPLAVVSPGAAPLRDGAREGAAGIATTGFVPQLSVVATARNDDHGGNLLGRMQIFVDGLLDHARRLGLRTELLLVEWNPVEGVPSLAEAIRWPARDPTWKARVVEVPPAVHRTLLNSERLPLFQMIAKNVGIRRSTAPFVLATNVDIVFSEELMRFVAGNGLRRSRMYRVDRYDVRAEVPAGAALDDQLEFCRNNLLRVHRREGTWNAQTGAFQPIYARRTLKLRIAEALQAWGALPFRSRERLHTNGCGDFTLMSREDWFALRGYAEFQTFSFHLDSLLCFAAHHAGVRERYLPDPMRIYHIEHGIGSGWTPEGQHELNQRLRTAGIAQLDPAALDAWWVQMRREGKTMIFNPESWGFAGTALSETVIG